MKTLAELNEGLAGRTQGWPFSAPQYTLEIRYGIGRDGFRRSGAKLHLVKYERIIEDHRTERKPGTMTVGAIFSAHACNTNGQHRAQVLTAATLDTKDITCTKCLRRLGVKEAK